MNLKPSDWEFKHILKSGIRMGRKKKSEGLISSFSLLGIVGSIIYHSI